VHKEKKGNRVVAARPRANRTSSAYTARSRKSCKKIAMDEPHAGKLARVVLTGGERKKAPYRNSSMCGASHLKPDDALRSAGALGSNPTPANS